MRRREKRGHLYLLTGLILGIMIGIVYAWIFVPVSYENTSPATLRQDLKNAYILEIAYAYAANGDLARAQQRLALLENPTIAQELTIMAQQALADSRSSEEVRALGLLANAAAQLPAVLPTAVPLTEFPTLTPTVEATLLASETASPTLPPTATQTPKPTSTQTPTITSTSALTGTETVPVETPFPTAFPTIAPTLTPTPTPGAPFVLDARKLSCDFERAQPLLSIWARDAAGNGVSGLEIVVNWASGEEHFFTGLKPEIDLGYADFVMTPGEVYTLRLADGSQRIADLTAEPCSSADGKQIWGSLELRFIQP